MSESILIRKFAILNDLTTTSNLYSLRISLIIEFSLLCVKYYKFIFQNKVTMVMGTTMFCTCLGYIIYMNVTDDKKKKSYVAITPDGTLESRQRTSKWD